MGKRYRDASLRLTLRQESQRFRESDMNYVRKQRFNILARRRFSRVEMRQPKKLLAKCRKFHGMLAVLGYVPDPNETPNAKLAIFSGVGFVYY